MNEQKIMDEFADLLSENTKLKQRVRELESGTRAAKASAVRSAANLIFISSAVMSSDCYHELNEMADKLEKGEIE